MSEQNRTGPVIIDIEAADLPGAPDPAEAPPVEAPAATPAAEQALRAAARPRPTLGLFGAAAAGLVALAVGLALHDFVAELFVRAGWLGWLGLGLLCLIGGYLLAGTVRELAALARLGRIERLQRRAEAMRQRDDMAGGEALVAELGRLYAARPDLAAARTRLAVAARDATDGGALVAAAEQAVMRPLDPKAEAAVARGARDVAAATALIPMPLVDVLAVLLGNIRMIRRIAEIYGGRAGWLGSWRLLRAVIRHLVATGAIAATDDMLGPMLGGGVLSRLSRRFGEAAVNAALTARVGVAAIEVCRPLPFVASTQPKASAIVMRALRSWRGTEPRSTT